MNKISNLLLVGLGLGFCLITSPAWSQCALEPNCALIWSDEFDGTAVDLTKWEPMVGDGSQFGIPGWGNNELQWYSANNATVANGVLTITATDQPTGNKNYTSARLRTLGKGDWTYGRFEMRAKLPVGQGMWPAFWMLSSVPDYGIWAASGEIDIMESLGNDPERIYATLHYGAPSPGNVSSGSSTRLPPGTAQDFHVYAVEWQEGQIRWYLDGQLYASQDDWYSTAAPFPAPFDVDFHLLLNLAVGGNFPGNPDASTVFPQEYIIDYVRVYDLPDEPPAPTELVFADMEHGDPSQSGWFSFSGNVGGGGIDLDFNDLPPIDGGSRSLQTGWGSGGDPGFYGGFGRAAPIDITGMTHFSFWINPDANQDYRLEFNLQDDDNGDGAINNFADDEFQYNCVISPSGPCVISGGGWQQVTVPLTDFFADNTFLFGGNDILDTQSAASGGNGKLINIVAAVIGSTGSAVTFRTDNWVFEYQSEPDGDGDGFSDSVDNCPTLANDQTDTDGDSIGNRCDNCSLTPNVDQKDSNGDSYGNHCDADLNNDGVVDFGDLSEFQAAFFTQESNPNWNPDADMNGDGVVDFADLSTVQSLFFQPPGPSGLVP